MTITIILATCREEGIEYQGSDLLLNGKTWKTDSIAECYKECKSDQRCRALVYKDSTKLCRPMFHVMDRIVNKDFTSMTLSCGIQTTEPGMKMKTSND